MLSKARLGALFILVFALQKGIAAETSLQGTPLQDYIESLSSKGLRINYSSDLVRDDYLIQQEPTAPDPIEALREVLRPYGLILSGGPAGSHLITKAAEDPRAGTVSLRVVGAGGSGGVALARVYVDDDLSGHTDASGSLILSSLSPGTHNVAVSADGYLDSAGTDVMVSRNSPASVGGHHQALRDHATQRFGEHGPHLSLLVGRKRADHAADGSHRVRRVQRGEH